MRELILRDYQQRLVDDIRLAWSDTQSVLAWLPTGGGKTEVSVHLAKVEAESGGCTLFVVDRRTLAVQARNRYSGQYGMLTGLLRGEDTYVRGYEPVLVASIQTLRARWEDEHVQRALERVTLVVVDEAHIKFKHHEDLLNHLPSANVLGLTATPLRDGLALLYGSLVRGPSYADLMDAGYLVSPRIFVPHVEDLQRGLRDVHVASSGDFAQGDLSQLMRKKAIIGDVVSTWQEKAENRHTIVFCVDIAHSQAVCDEFALAGVAAEHIDMRTTEAERAAMFQRFRRGETRVLCSIVVLGVGFDEPSASCAVLARPTLSLSMHIQQIGRVLRPFHGKDDALILDHAGNVLRHGRVEDFIPPELSEVDKTTDRVKRDTVKDDFPCSECRALMRPGQRVCSECGHEIARPNNVIYVPGKLVEPDDDHNGMAMDELMDIYAELVTYARNRGWKDGWAFHKMREHFDLKPPYSWRDLPPRRPSQRVMNLIKSWAIAFRKRELRPAS